MKFGNVRLEPLNVMSAVAAINTLQIRTRTRGRGADVHLCNAFTLVSASETDLLASILERSALNLVDGVAVQKVLQGLNLLRERRAGRIGRSAGPDLMHSMLSSSSERSHFLLGPSDALNSAIVERYQTAHIVGHYAPPYKEVFETEDIAQIAARISLCEPDIVWVGLGTPKQDLVAAALASETKAVCIGIGAAFDFLGGSKARAPVWMRRAGLEWMHRLLAEPGRLWRRYLIGNVKFIRLAAKICWSVCIG